LDSDVQALAHCEPTDAAAGGMLNALVSSMLADPDRALVSNLPGLRGWSDELLAPLLRSSRARNVAVREGITTVGVLGAYTPARLLALRQVDIQTVHD
jgi:hypothetical protein